VRMGDAERIAAWRRVIALGKRLGDELMELIDSGRVAQAAQALS